METLPEGYFDSKIQSIVIKRDENWIVSVTPMIFNDRVILTATEEYPDWYTAGFCYDKGPAAILAAMAWDPYTQFRPAGFKKIACDARPTPTFPDKVGTRTRLLIPEQKILL